MPRSGDVPDRPGQLEHLDGTGQAPDGYPPQGLRLYIALGQAQRVRGQQARAGTSKLFQARRQMCRLAHSRVVHAQVAADGAHHDLAGIEADANLDVDAARAAKLGGVVTYRFLHAEGGITGANGVVLVGEGRPEERHDAVAHHLVDRAFVAVDRFHHQLEHRLEDRVRLLRIPVGKHLH